MKKLFLILAFLLLAASAEAATTYYVAQTGGSDSNSCAQAQTHTTAKATIRAGIECMSGGDRLEIKAGTYAYAIAQDDGCTPSGSSWGTATTITRYASDVVTIERVASCGNSPSSYVIYDGLTINANYAWAEAIWIGVGSHHIRFINSTICCATSVPIQTSISSTLGGNEFIRNYIYNFTDPGSPVGSHALYLGSPASLVEYNEVTNFGGACVQVYTGDDNFRTDNTIIRYNWCHDGSGANTQGVQGASWAFILANGDNLQAYGNLVTNLLGRPDGCCGTIGIGGSSNNAKVFNNTLFNNPSYGIGVTGDNGHEIKNNLLWQNGTASGFDFSTRDILLDGGATTAGISNNLCMVAGTGCSVTTDPLFVSTTDLRLQTGSPAKDAGADLGAPYNADYAGVSRPQGIGWEIGAFEFPVVPVPSRRRIVIQY